MTSFKRFNQLASTPSGAFPDLPRSEDPRVWARRKINERLTKSNIIPFFYKESLRFMISKLGGLSYISSDQKVVDVQCVHANPERTVAKLKQENNIILPIISINQNISDNDEDRRRLDTSLVLDTWWSEERKRAYRVISAAPRAVNIEYGINVWAKYKNNLDQLAEQIRLLFNPQLVVTNSYTTVANAYLGAESDNSTIDTPDREERIIRRSFGVSLEAYVPSPKFLITSTGEIQEFNSETEIY